MTIAGRFALAALVCVGAAQFAMSAAPAVRTLARVDEAPKRADFLAFRGELRQIVAKRDVQALLRVVHPQIKNSFGGDDGIAAFRRIWRLEQGDSELWRELGAILSLGGTFQDAKTFVAPYVFSRWPDDLDSFDHVALTGSRVRVRAGPSIDARPLATLDFALLERGDDNGERGPWMPVVLPDGRKGFVSSDFARSPVDYRAYFNDIDGRWQLTLLVAGD